MDTNEIQSALHAARGHQRAGRLREAEGLYQQVLSIDPNRDDVLAALAQVRFQLGDATSAADLLRRATVLKPQCVEYLANLGMVLARHRQSDEAIECLRRAAELRPQSPELLNNLGAALSEQKRLDEAVDALSRAVALRPGYAEAHYNLGVAFQHQEKWGPAKAAFEQSLSLRPGHASALINLGAVLLKLDQPDAAGAAYRNALGVNPNLPEAWYGLGCALQQLGQEQQAIAQYRQALALRPDFADPHYNLGNAALEGGRTDEAIEHFRQALSIRPDFAEAANNLAIALERKERWEEAAQVLRDVRGLRPDHAPTDNNLGAVLQAMGRFDEAIEAYQKAVELQPDFAEAMWNKGIVLLSMGRFKEGWEAYEARHRSKGLSPDPDFGKPKWDGSDLCSRTILLHAEQGFGDTIQFVRYLPMVRRRGPQRVLLMCPRPLHPLLAGKLGIDQLIGGGDALPDFDVHFSLPSLPYRFGTALGTIPADVPYLTADPDRMSKWRERLEGERKLKVGLAWAGNPLHRHDKERSLPLSALAPLANFKDIHFVSLQKGQQASQVNSPPDGLELADWTDELNDFADTAALIMNLDLVITVDTAIAHLAGALARPAWVLLAIPTDWRWMLDRADSPWYPTLRLFRQPARHDWQTPIANIVAELAKRTTS